MSKRRRGGSPSKSKTGRPVDKEWPEVLNLGQACEYLGVSRAKITKLIKGNILPFGRNELDNREKLVKREALEEIVRRSLPE